MKRALQKPGEAGMVLSLLLDNVSIVIMVIPGVIVDKEMAVEYLV
jgi:hypothetical protein